MCRLILALAAALFVASPAHAVDWSFLRDSAPVTLARAPVEKLPAGDLFGGSLLSQAPVYSSASCPCGDNCPCASDASELEALRRYRDRMESWAERQGYRDPNVVFPASQVRSAVVRTSPTYSQPLFAGWTWDPAEGAYVKYGPASYGGACADGSCALPSRGYYAQGTPAYRPYHSAPVRTGPVRSFQPVRRLFGGWRSYSSCGPGGCN